MNTMRRAILPRIQWRFEYRADILTFRIYNLTIF
jgi:hypothetical protein